MFFKNYIEQSPQQRIILSKKSIVLSLRNPAMKKHLYFYGELLTGTEETLLNKTLVLW